MNILKITDRQEVLERVLREAFKPKFDAILEEVKTLLISHLNQKHPVFMEMLSDKQKRHYMAVSHTDRLYIGERRCAYPIYGKNASMPQPHHFIYRSDEYAAMTLKDVNIPMSMNEFIIDEKAELFKTYSATWKAYSEAYKELSGLLNSYRSRDKFEKDFPEYKDYLPALEVKKQLPQVIASEVRGKLSSLGIPAK